ncbi:unnamed protein product [Parnassius apollo]|uniref:(apollo) hypothetical protein n=1 Tax=Parnassius apollo TaxID=110799 RepID=A0A8S3W5T6_PARAO|nr:unnamed protein product [Parnassius apollo]
MSGATPPRRPGRAAPRRRPRPVAAPRTPDRAKIRELHHLSSHNCRASLLQIYPAHTSLFFSAIRQRNPIGKITKSAVNAVRCGCERAPETGAWIPATGRSQSSRRMARLPESLAGAPRRASPPRRVT